MNQVLESYAVFERKTVLGTLKVLATLIDWNDVSLFQQCMATIGSFFRVKGLRTGAF